MSFKKFSEGHNAPNKSEVDRKAAETKGAPKSDIKPQPSNDQSPPKSK